MELRRAYGSVFCEIMSPCASPSDDKYALNKRESGDSSDSYPQIAIKSGFGFPSSVNNDVGQDEDLDDEVNIGSRAYSGNETELNYRTDTEQERLTLEGQKAHALDSSLH